MSVVITKKQFSDALAETAMALTMAMPEIVRAIAHGDKEIAIRKLALMEQVTDQSNSPWANLFIHAMLAAVEQWDDPALPKGR